MTYSVVASPGGASVTTSTTTAIMDDLTNGQEYTFRIQAINSVGALAPSEPSAGVTPFPTIVTTPDSNCVTTPVNYEEELLPSGGRKMAFQVPCMPGHGRVRLGAFIKDKEVKFLPHVYTLGIGNDRGFDPGMDQDDNKVYIELDFSRGTGFVFSAHSCSDASYTNCSDARPIGDTFLSSVQRDGGVALHFEITNSITADTPVLNWLKISADLVVLPLASGSASAPQNICVAGDVSSYPSAEGYYDNNGVTYTLYQLTQKPYGVSGLAISDRDLPEC